MKRLPDIPIATNKIQPLFETCWNISALFCSRGEYFTLGDALKLVFSNPKAVAALKDPKVYK